MALIEGQTFRDQTLHLDGNTYRKCDIQRCRLVYSGGDPFTLDTCVISNCGFDFEGAAMRTLRTLAFYYSVPEFRAIAQRIIDDIQRGPQRPPQMPPGPAH
jgi:hypothetical protein